MSKTPEKVPQKPRALEMRINADGSADLWLFGTFTDEHERDGDIMALDVVAALNRMPDVDNLTVHLNSNGGDVFEGMSIYNTLRTCGKTVNVIGEGVVASIASVIALAGNSFAMAENSLFMVHNPLVLLLGSFNKHDMAKMAEELDTVRDAILSAYTGKTGMTNDEIIALLDGPKGQGTYMTPREALAAGFCDGIIPGKAKPMTASQTNTFKCRGHVLRLDISAPATSGTTKTGGSTMAVKTKAARRGKIKAELVSIECPHCGGVMNLDTANGIVSVDPAEGATVAVPTEDTVAMRGTKTFRNEAWKITCPHCAGAFDYDTAPDGALSAPEGDPGSGSEAPPLPQANRKPRVKATKTRVVRMQTAPLPITCTECGTEFEVDMDPTIQEATVLCPNCSTELAIATGTESTEPNAPNPDPAAKAPAVPVQTAASDAVAVTAFRNGIAEERRRLMLLDERAKAFPQYTNAIEGFKRNGTSVETANNWIFQAMAASREKPAAGSAYREAARRDATVLNRIGTATPAGSKSTAVADRFESLAKRRGTLKNA